MNVTREVIQDLLPLYQEGEASPDTRRLVEEYLKSDPKLAGQLAAAATLRVRRILIPQADQALATLEETRRVIRRQKWTQFFALFLTLAPFSFAFQGGELKYMLLRDAPLSVIPLWGGAALLWLSYFKSRR